jgi:hypothetical protein
MLVQQENDAYLNFINCTKSDVTKQIYEYNLRLFMEFCNVNKFEDLIEIAQQPCHYYEYFIGDKLFFFYLMIKR